MLRAYKYRIYPTVEQRIQLAKTFGCVRFVYNRMLADRKAIYEANKDLEVKQCKLPTPAQYKDEFIWLKEVDSLALANTQLNLDKAYRNFFRNKATGFPKFKNKKTNYDAYTTNNQDGTVRIENSSIKLPKFKSFIKIKQHRIFSGVIKSCTISRTSSNKYFISILTDEEITSMEPSNNSIGIDVGLKEFAVTSSGEIFENPKWLRKSQKRLKKLQKDLSRKKKGGKNRNRARKRVSRLHEKISNQRKDFLHKLSTQLIRENQSLVIEDLRVKNLMKNSRLAQAIAEVSWAEFRRMLEYKAEWYGRNLIIAPSNYASSQLCSECGYKNVNTKKLSVRNWICPVCGSQHDRDINAARNLLKLAG